MDSEDNVRQLIVDFAKDNASISTLKVSLV